MAAGVLARSADPGGARQPAQPGARCAGRGQSSGHVRRAWACRRVDRGTAHRCGRPAAAGPGASRRTEQRHGDTGRGRAADLQDRLRAEPVQPGASRRRRPDRRSWPRRHRLCAVLSARWLQPVAVVGFVRGRPASRRHADAGGARLAASPGAQHPADPRHFVYRRTCRRILPRPGARCRTMRSRNWMAWQAAAPINPDRILSPQVSRTPSRLRSDTSRGSPRRSTARRRRAPGCSRTASPGI